MMPETELKFLIAEADLSRLLTLPSVRDRIAGANIHRSKTTYFDSARRGLWRHGFSLRIRNVGGHLIQTLKQDRASLIERGEWECEIQRPENGAPLRPDLRMIDDTPLAGALGDTLWATLRPAFEVDVERTVFPWVAGAAMIEVAIDRGAIRALEAPGPTHGISEVELELKQGEAAAAFAVARILAAQAPLTLSLISKAERGQRLLAGSIAAPAKPSKPQISGPMRIRTAFKSIIRASLHDFMLNVAALDGPDPVEAVHQGRVSLRRLRAALALFKPFARAADYARINDALRRVARVFGAARDRDVAAGCAAPASDFAEWLEARRRAARESVRDVVASESWRLFLIDFAEWVENGPWREPSADRRPSISRFVRKQLRRRRKELLRMARGLARLGRDGQHRVRIKAKKLRYIAQFFAGLPGVADRKQMNRLLNCLDKLQSGLGDLRDAAARRRMAKSEFVLWRSAAGNVDAASRAAAARLAAPTCDEAECLDMALKARSMLARTNPF